MDALPGMLSTLRSPIPTGVPTEALSAEQPVYAARVKMPGERAGFTFDDAMVVSSAFADTVPVISRQIRKTTARTFIEFNTMGAILSFSKQNQVEISLFCSGKPVISTWPAASGWSWCLF
jgi:hypothetical protein